MFKSVKMHNQLGMLFLQVLLAFVSINSAKKDIFSHKLSTTTPLTVTNHQFAVNASAIVKKLDHFWKSTGFCPPDPHSEFHKFMATNDMAQNLVYVGSVPNQGISQVRIHFLLDLVSMSSRQNGSLVFSFVHLDEALDMLVKDNRLRPGFELMGNPSNYFTDFDDEKQIYDWMELIKELGLHVIDRYGLEEVSQWNFESWNEPFSRIAFVGLNVSLQGYLNYYDACSEGLRMANPALRLGGPATGNPLYHEKSSKIFYTFLQHCYDGVNFITGDRGVRLDFISFHIKGQGLSSYILETEQVVLDQIQRQFPKFAGIPVYNDEADPLVGWETSEEWRADARYAAMVVKVIAQHQNRLIPNKQVYKLLSNDNDFLNYHPSYFSQRTLLARFQMNLTQPRKVEFIKKPVLGVMGLLALLGDQQVSTEKYCGRQAAAYDDVGIIASIVHNTATSQDWELSALIYNSNDTTNKTGLAVVDVVVSGIPLADDILYVIYKIDNYHGNPYALWMNMKSPVFPTEDQFRELRLHQEPVRTVGPLPPAMVSGIFSLKLQLPLPGVALLHFCRKPLTPPTQPVDAAALRISTTEVLVHWKHDNAKCIKTYQVLYSVSEEGPYKVVNEVDLIFWAFLHVISSESREKIRDHTSSTWYKVRAVDYWNRVGEESHRIPAPQRPENLKT